MYKRITVRTRVLHLYDIGNPKTPNTTLTLEEVTRVLDATHCLDGLNTIPIHYWNPSMQQAGHKKGVGKLK